MRRAMIFVFMLSAGLLADDTLTVGRAVELGLANNFNIRIARNTAQKADNTRKLKAGYALPAVTATGGAVYSDTKYGSATAQYIPGNGDLVTSAGVSLNWTLFDGFRMFYAMKLVEQSAEYSEQVSRLEIESSVVNTITAFYGLASAQSLLSSAKRQLEISRKQLAYAQDQYRYGRATKRELLNGKVLVNTDSAAVAARRLDLARARHALNAALGRKPGQTVAAEADTALPLPENDAAFWFEKAREYNAGVQMADIQRRIAASQLGIARAAFWPVLAAQGSYTYNWADPDYSRTQAGVTLTWPLFTGFSRLVSAQNAGLDKENADLAYEQKSRDLEALVHETWLLFTNAYEQAGFGRTTVDLAGESLEISMEQYRLGKISDVQLREAQLSLLNAEVRLESAVFQCKTADAQLRQLAGMLKVK